MEHKRIKVRLIENSHYPYYGYYEKGDICYIDGYVNDDAVIILENGKFAKADLRWIEVVNEEDKDVNSELAESEDERIRKELMAMLSDAANNIEHIYYASDCKRWLAWLEKQKPKKHDVCDTCDEKASCVNPCPVKLVGQKPIDKVEPKFHKGEWVVYECGEEIATLQITRIVGETYVFSDDSTLGVVDEDTLRLWDITKDAKAGDVLVASDGSIFLFAGVINCSCKYYVALTTDNYVKINKINKEENGGYWETSRAVYPATKEQRDLLFQKMKEKGYEWDFEKKELKKIEQKSVWSEKDEKMLDEIYEFFDKHKINPIKHDMDDYAKFIKSLKDRVQPQSRWKPSEEQIKGIECAIKTLQHQLNVGDKRLNSLYDDLKKLKEE